MIGLPKPKVVLSKKSNEIDKPQARKYKTQHNTLEMIEYN